MKNLCFLCFCAGDRGGVNRIVISLCNELCKNSKYKVHILSICGGEALCAYDTDERVTKNCLGASTCWRLRKTLFFSSIKILKYIKNNRIDEMFLIGHYTPIMAVLSAFLTKCKFIFCDHGALENQLSDKKATFFRKLASKISDKVIVLTERSKQAYEKYFKLKSGKVDCIYNFLEESAIKNAGNYNVNSKKILSVGRVTSEKGYDMLLDIAYDVLKKHDDWEWHVYGSGDSLCSIRSKIEKMGLGKRLIFKGGGYDTYKIYKDYGIYVLTSYREGLPLVLLEAKANKIPIVSFDCVTGPSEIVRNGIDGYLIECYNKKNMAEKICSLIEDEKLRIKMSENSQENLKKFDFKEIIVKWEKLIDEI